MLGLEFLRAIEACLSGVTRNPFASTVVKVPNVRRALIRRFPYALFYLVDDEAIVVIAVFNGKRQLIGQSAYKITPHRTGRDTSKESEYDVCDTFLEVTSKR